MAKFPLETIRHSASHLMAAAVLELYPDVKFDIGPSTEDGFYYDFEADSGGFILRQNGVAFPAAQ